MAVTIPARYQYARVDCRGQLVALHTTERAADDACGVYRTNHRPVRLDALYDGVHLRHPAGHEDLVACGLQQTWRQYLERTTPAYTVVYGWRCNRDIPLTLPRPWRSADGWSKGGAWLGRGAIVLWTPGGILGGLSCAAGKCERLRVQGSSLRICLYGFWYPVTWRHKAEAEELLAGYRLAGKEVADVDIPF